MRRFLMVLPAMALALSATYAQAGGRGCHRARCRPAPCASACSPCGGGYAVSGGCGAGAGYAADGGSMAVGGGCGPQYTTEERTVMVPEMATETRTVTVTQMTQEPRHGLIP